MFTVDVPTNGVKITSDTPLVLVFGWINARDAHVCKYSRMVNDACACVTVRSTIPTAVGFDPRASPREKYVREALRRAEDAVKEVYPPGEGPKRRYLYVFSNGGCWVVSTLASSMKFSRAERAAFDGVVFDSCPAFMSMKSGGDALTAVMRQPMKTVVRLVFYFAVTILMLYHVVTFSLDEMLTRKFWSTMLTMEPFPKELYVYSANDTLTDASKLEGLVMRRMKDGANVKSLRFEDSRHCAHLRSHRDEYIAAMKQFFV